MRDVLPSHCYFLAGGHESAGGVAHVEAGGGTSGLAVFAPAGGSFAAAFTVTLPLASTV
jgi:hypothetical protein